MTNKLKTLSLALLLIALAAPIRTQAQQTDVYLRGFPSSWFNSYFEPGFDGAGIGVGYHPLLNKYVKLNIFGEFLVLRSRNEFLLGFGINKTFWQADHFRVSIESNLLSGIELYRPAPLFTGGLEAGARFDYYLKKRLSLFIAVSARLTMVPGYRDIGVWTHSSWPVTVGLRF
jgi:hypothetical protein